MANNRCCRAFTLIELLIVVVILAVLAGTMIQHAVVSTDDAKRSTLVHNLYVLRAQIEMYKLNHNGAVPSLQNSSLPQLTSATNSSGAIGAPGPNFPFGPYVSGGQFPDNPFDQKNIVTATAIFPPTASTSAGGWLFHESTGRIAANTDAHLSD
jgi:general secretion pathway protein G